MNIVNEIIRGVWLMQPDTARGYYPMIHKVLTGEVSPMAESAKENPVSIAQMDTGDNLVIDTLNEDTDNDLILIMDIFGPITKYDQFCGPLGMAAKTRMLKEADKLDQVKAHVIHIDSGGGEGTAARLMAETIGSLSKPTFAFIDGMGASAAYWIASACDFIAASSPMDRIGSIGTYISIADYTKWYLDQGLRIIDVYASESSDKNRDYLDAIEGNTARLQSLADKFNTHFLSAVMENRHDKLSEGAKWNTGEVFFAQEALDIGLIDAISTFDNYISEILKTLKS